MKKLTSTILHTEIRVRGEMLVQDVPERLRHQRRNSRGNLARNVRAKEAEPVGKALDPCRFPRRNGAVRLRVRECTGGHIREVTSDRVSRPASGETVIEGCAIPAMRTR